MQLSFSFLPVSFSFFHLSFFPVSFFYLIPSPSFPSFLLSYFSFSVFYCSIDLLISYIFLSLQKNNHCYLMMRVTDIVVTNVISKLKNPYPSDPEVESFFIDLNTKLRDCVSIKYNSSYAISLTFFLCFLEISCLCLLVFVFAFRPRCSVDKLIVSNRLSIKASHSNQRCQ